MRCCLSHGKAASHSTTRYQSLPECTASAPHCDAPRSTTPKQDSPAKHHRAHHRTEHRVPQRTAMYHKSTQSATTCRSVSQVPGAPTHSKALQRVVLHCSMAHPVISMRCLSVPSKAHAWLANQDGDDVLRGRRTNIRFGSIHSTGNTAEFKFDKIAARPLET